MRRMILFTAFMTSMAIVPAWAQQRMGGPLPAVQALPVETIDAKRLNELTELPDYYQGALTPELEKHLLKNHEDFAALVESPGLAQALYTRRDLQRDLARKRITLEQIRERVMPNVQAYEQRERELKAFQREKEANQGLVNSRVRQQQRSIGGVRQ